MLGDNAHSSTACEIAGNGMGKFVSRQASVSPHHLSRWVSLEDAQSVGRRATAARQLTASAPAWRVLSICQSLPPVTENATPSA